MADTPPGWHLVDGAFVREFRFPSYAQAAEFVARIGRIADEVDHHPEVSLQYPGVVSVHTTSHDAGGVTSRDVRLTALVDALAV
ncbi:MAG: 4a-hydroxytetrahydrobiopterin dehydratase [Actinobacteria bacterium]|nr:4a-hydroxytetrahydrobiopterin dehydratase [Actinomycetota bacterium]